MLSWIPGAAGLEMRARLLARRASLGVVAAILAGTGCVFLLIALYQALLTVVPPAGAALLVAALAFGAGAVIVLVLRSRPAHRAPPPAAAPDYGSVATPLLSIVRLSLLARFLRARPLTIMAAALVAGAAAAWGTRPRHRD
jgi:hypothetical protein